MLLLKLEKLKKQQAAVEQQLRDEEQRELAVAGRVLAQLLKDQPQSRSAITTAAGTLNLNKRDRALFNSFSKKHTPPAIATGSLETQKVAINEPKHLGQGRQL